MKHGFVIKTRKNTDKKNYVKTVTTIIVAAILMSSSSITFFPPQQADAKIADAKKISIASWNTFDFGGKFGGKCKSTDPTILTAMTDVISKYDIIFVQEIANLTKVGACNPNKPFSGFNTLCGSSYLGNLNYLCKDTGVIGSGEGYGLIYKNNVLLSSGVSETRTDLPTSNPYIPLGSGSGAMKRPPMKATLPFANEQVIVYNAHTSPSGGVPKEIRLMSQIITPNYDLDKNNVIVLGDLNADGKRPAPPKGNLDGGTNYYPGGFSAHPNDFQSSKWTQTVTDTDITNFATTLRAYDRIILSNGLTNSYENNNYGIVGAISVPVGSYPAGTPFNQIFAGGGNSGKALSDHRLVWATLNFGGIESTNSLGNTESAFYDFKPPSCTTPDKVYVKGKGFVPNQPVDIYVTSQPANQNDNAGNFKKTGQSYNLVDVSGGPLSISTDPNGNITNRVLWSQPTPGSPALYNIIVDVNKDGYFTNGVDVVDAFNTDGFNVSNCPKKKLKAAAEPVPPDGDGSRDFSTAVPAIYFSGDGFDQGSARIYIIAYNKDFNYSGNVATKLVDVRGSYDSITVGSSKQFSGPSWQTLQKGNYNIVFDANSDGMYKKSDGDIIDYVNEIGFIVLDNYPAHNNISDLDDNANEREDYDAKQAENIYVLAHNLPPDANPNVDLYVMSERLLKINNPGWTTWEQSSNVDLMQSATPTDNGDRIKTVTVSPQNTLFDSVWHKPSIVYDQKFINYYGKKYTIVVDANQDGKYNPSDDLVDTHDIGDMKNYFELGGGVELSPTSGNNQKAVSEYKEYLNSKLDLEHPLNDNNEYDPATEIASLQYLCDKNLSSFMFDKIIKSGSQTGFVIFNQDEYYAGRDLNSGRHVYDQVEFDVLMVQDNDGVVVSANSQGKLDVAHLTLGKSSTMHMCGVADAKIHDLTLKENAKANINADNSFKISGKTNMGKDSSLCVNMIKGTAAAVATGAALILGSIFIEVVSFGTATPFLIGLGVAGATAAAAETAACL